MILQRELLRAHERALSLAEARRTSRGAWARSANRRVEHGKEEGGVRVDERGTRLDAPAPSRLVSISPELVVRSSTAAPSPERTPS